MVAPLRGPLTCINEGVRAYSIFMHALLLLLDSYCMLFFKSLKTPGTEINGIDIGIYLDRWMAR